MCNYSSCGPEHALNEFDTKVRYIALVSALSAMLAGCLGVPDGVSVVKNFELDRYLGTWYEIARLDHRFERGLSQVQANYSLREDGGVRVINLGFDAENSEWSEAEGKAYFIGDPDLARLKVSFFGPFYGAYNVIELDQENYSYAMIAGPSYSYLWILSREPRLEPAILDGLVARARVLGFPVDELIYPEHNGAPD